jgi:Fe-S-cluster containining protein
MTTIRETLPAAHRRFLPRVFDRAEIPERRATCNDCAMCAKAGENKAPEADEISFKPNLKCCTYHPTLPNFLVGAVLSDAAPEMAEGRRRMQERIRSRVGVTPQWLSPSRKYRVLLDAARATSFGRSKVLLCPFFVDDGGLCSIWRHREAVCSTFFCKHEAGAAGHAFWTAQKQLLAQHEVVLSRYAAHEVYPDAAEPAFPRMRLTLEDLEDRAPNDADYAACWGEWAGREEEFYRRTFELVSSLAQDKVDELLKNEPRTDELVASLSAKHDAITSPRLAERLVMNPELRATPIGDSGAMAVTTYSAYDPMMLIPELWAVLPEFNGEETVAEVKARLDKEKDVEIGDDLLLILQNHAILVPPAT